MKVAVRLFARYREAAGRDHVELELPEGGTVESAWEAVASRFPVLQPYRPFTLFALGTDYVSSTHPLRSGDEICLFPPVSGGSAGDLYFNPLGHPHGSATLLHRNAPQRGAAILCLVASATPVIAFCHHH